jgi:hypothetical protein
LLSYLRPYLALKKILDKVFMKLGMNITALALLLIVFLRLSPLGIVTDNFTYSIFLFYNGSSGPFRALASYSVP